MMMILLVLEVSYESMRKTEVGKELRFPSSALMVPLLGILRQPGQRFHSNLKM